MDRRKHTFHCMFLRIIYVHRDKYRDYKNQTKRFGYIANKM